jgi:quinol monooxygenase YgiN
MTRFAQHTTVRARPGKRDALAAKFVETLALLRDNPDCQLTLVSTSPDDADVVVLTEVWSSKAAHEAVVASAAVQAWASDMPDLVYGPPVTQLLEPVALLAREL